MSKRVWIVAAGTGGHIFPGVSLAQALKEQDPSLDFLFFGTHDRLEARLVPSAGFRIKFLNAGRWKGSGLLGKLKGLFSICLGMMEALVEGFQNKPALVISVGGYVSVPVVLASRFFRAPFFILEPNIRAGMANRWLSHFAREAFSSPGSDAQVKFKCPVHDLGNPVRKDLNPVEIRSQVKRILVLGGSQGALSLCRATLKLAEELNFEQKGLLLHLQAGEKNVEQALEWQKEFRVESCTQVVPFVYKVPQALKESDVVIARAGASTVAELAVVGLPTIFVPFPYAADDHQRVNAQLLQEDGAALMADEKDTHFQENLQKHVEDLCLSKGHPERRAALSSSFKKWGRPRADQDIAKSILSNLARKG